MGFDILLQNDLNIAWNLILDNYLFDTILTFQVSCMRNLL